MKTLCVRAWGFSLIEMMVTLVILALVMFLAMPSFQAWIENSRIRNAAESILNGLQTARNEAVRRNASVQFVLGAGSSWTVSCVVTTPGCPDLNAIQSRVSGEGSGSSVTVAVNPNGTVVFNSFGAMTAPVPDAGNVARLDVDTTKLSAEDSRDLRVTIDAGGNVRMCDPNTAAPDPRAC